MSVLYSFPRQKKVGQVGRWLRVEQETRITCCLFPSSSPTLLTPSLTSFLCLPPSLPLAFFLFSKTDRTRDACESKDERPVREVYVRVCEVNE